MLPQLRGAPLVALSAETGRGLDRLMPAVVKAHADWSTKGKTRDLNDWLATRRAPPAAGGAAGGIRPKYMAQTKARPPTFVLFASRADELPDSYRRYLVNSPPELRPARHADPADGEGEGQSLCGEEGEGPAVN